MRTITFKDVMNSVETLIESNRKEAWTIAAGVVKMNDEERNECFGVSDLNDIFSVCLDDWMDKIECWSANHIGRAADLGFYMYLLR